MKNFRDIEQLSAYLDGQLSPSESARMESRINSDTELASAFNDLRAARGILRKLPARKAPRNFTLTRQMVGLKPPMPRSYSFFRFSTAFATFLLMLTFATNAIAPRLTVLPASVPLGIGSGGGCDSCFDPELVFATEAPAATEVPAAAAAEAPPLELSAPATEAPFAADNAEIAREMGTPTAEIQQFAKDQPTESALPEQTSVNNEANDAVVSIQWQLGLLGVILVSGMVMFLLGQTAKQKWK